MITAQSTHIPIYNHNRNQHQSSILHNLITQVHIQGFFLQVLYLPLSRERLGHFVPQFHHLLSIYLQINGPLLEILLKFVRTVSEVLVAIFK